MSPHEEIKLVRGYPGHHLRHEHPAMLYRYGRPIAGFFLSERQLTKVSKKQGRIEITDRQIERYNHNASPYGR